MSTKHLKTLRVIGENTMQVIEGVVIELGTPATAIVDVQLDVRDMTEHIFRNKVVKQGYIHVNLIYKGMDGVVHYESANVPFEEEVEIGGLVPGIKIDGYVRVPVQDAEATLDIQNYIMAMDSDARPVESDSCSPVEREKSSCYDDFEPTFDQVLIKVMVEILVKVSRWEQMDVFTNGRNGVFRFTGVNRPTNNNNDNQF